MAHLKMPHLNTCIFTLNIKRILQFSSKTISFQIEYEIIFLRDFDFLYKKNEGLHIAQSMKNNIQNTLHPIYSIRKYIAY